jgi:phospholipid/cholesterol/gamma-HCH transport system permease protein
LLVEDELQKSPEVRRIGFDSGNLLSWDSTLLAFLIRVSEFCRRRGIELDRHGLPAGVCKLLDLAQAVPEKKGARKTKIKTTFVHYVGDCAIAARVSLGEILKFTVR